MTVAFIDACKNFVYHSYIMYTQYNKNNQLKVPCKVRAGQRAVTWMSVDCLSDAHEFLSTMKVSSCEYACQKFSFTKAHT